MLKFLEVTFCFLRLLEKVSLYHPFFSDMGNLVEIRGALDQMQSA